MKFLRTLRLDNSDEHVYAPAAAVGELAVPGTFVFTFADEDPEALAGKARQAFRTGFLGLTSFGWSTVVRIDEISDAEYKSAIEGLAHHMVEAWGAPSLAEALPFARQEIEYAAGLCEDAPGTLLALERHADEAGVHETFKRVQPPKPARQVADWQGHDGEVRIWDMFPEDGSR